MQWVWFITVVTWHLIVAFLNLTETEYFFPLLTKNGILTTDDPSGRIRKLNSISKQSAPLLQEALYCAFPDATQRQANQWEEHSNHY